MCGLFGLIDYQGSLSSKTKSKIINVLAIACSERGKDATGIAYVTNKIRVYKKPLPASKMSFSIPDKANVIMGHTRLTTQGNASFNQNNHPFHCYINSDTEFALAHNGVIHNEDELRKDYHLRKGKIETDSYVAAQLLEQSKCVDFSSVKSMAEKIEGTFTFTVLDNNDQLFIVKGNNPLVIYHFKTYGFYVYASTKPILDTALKKLRIMHILHDEVKLAEGEIACICKNGNVKTMHFEMKQQNYFHFNFYAPVKKTRKPYSTYVEELYYVSKTMGFNSSDIDALLYAGYSIEEIDDLLYDPEAVERIVNCLNGYF